MNKKRYNHYLTEDNVKEVDKLINKHNKKCEAGFFISRGKIIDDYLEQIKNGDIELNFKKR